MASKRKNAQNSATKDILQQNVAAAKERDEVVVSVVEPTAPETPVEEQVVPTVVAPEPTAEETNESKAPAEEIKESKAPAEETKESEAPVEETKESEAPVEETKESEAPAEETKEPEAPAEETKELEAPVEETKESEAPAEETKEPEAPAEETKELEAPAEETKEPEVPKKDDGFKKFVIAGGLVGLVLLLSTFVVLLCLLFRGENTQSPANTGETTGVETTAPTESSSSTQNPEPEQPAFDVKAFEKKAVRLAEAFGNTNAAADVSKLTSLLGTEKLASLAAEYGEAKLAKELAVLVTFAPEAVGKAYADEIGSQWISTNDFFDAQFEKSDEYKAATGKNPETVLMTLQDPDNPAYNYETFKGNVDALLALAEKTMSASEYTLFEEWLTMRNSGFALANKVEKHIVSKKQTLLTSEGSLEFFELQMKMVEGGMVTTTAGNQASAEYVEFVQTNFYIITAGA